MQERDAWELVEGPLVAAAAAPVGDPVRAS
jgi:hypothetical protein